MIGAIIGDIAGTSFSSPTTTADNLDFFASGANYTAVTVCSIAIAEALLNDSDIALSLRKWAERYPEPLGAYETKFAQWLAQDNAPAYHSYNSEAGARACACGWLAQSLDESYVFGDNAAFATHSHPEGVKASETLSVCVYFLRKGRDKKFIREYVDLFYGEIPPFQAQSFDDSSQRTMPLAFACYLSSNSFEDALGKAMMCEGNRSRLGAIVGALAAAEYGVPAEWQAKALTYLPEDMQAVCTAVLAL